MIRFLSLTLCLSLALAGCGAAEHANANEARLFVLTEPETAAVYVNDRYSGTGKILSKVPAEAGAGIYRITVRLDGYFPHDTELELKPGTTTLRVKLRKVPI